MEMFFVFLMLGIIMFIGYFAEILFDKTNIPDVLLLMIVGVLIGAVFRLTSPAQLAPVTSVFTVFALIFMLFEGAIHLNIITIIREVPKGLRITIAGFVISSLAVALITWWITPFSFMTSLLLGFIVGGSSSSVIIPLAKKVEMEEDTKNMLILESAFTDVLCIVAAVTLIEILISGVFDAGNVLNSLLGSFSIGALIGAVVGLIWVFMLVRLEKYSTTYMLTIAMLLVVYGVSEYVNSNGAIAALVFGLVIGNSRRLIKSLHETIIDKTAKVFYSEVSFFIKTFFFVYIGILVDFTHLKFVLIGVGLTVLIYLVRPVAVFFGLWPHQNDYTRKDKAFIESMTPKGLAAAVLAQLPMSLGLQGFEGFTTIVVTIIFSSIFFCSLFVFLIEKNFFNGLGHYYFRTKNSDLKKPTPKNTEKNKVSFKKPLVTKKSKSRKISKK